MVAAGGAWHARGECGVVVLAGAETGSVELADGQFTTAPPPPSPNSKPHRLPVSLVPLQRLAHSNDSTSLSGAWPAPVGTQPKHASLDRSAVTCPRPPPGILFPTGDSPRPGPRPDG